MRGNFFLLRSNSADGIDVTQDEQRIAVSLVGLKAKEEYFSFALFTTPSRLSCLGAEFLRRFKWIPLRFCVSFFGDPSAEIRKERSPGTS